MDLLKKRARLRAILVSAGLAAALALPIGVNADTTGGSPGGATIAVGTDARLTAKVAVTVDVSFTCDPFILYDWESGASTVSTVGRLEFGRVTITQASGRSINSGEAEFYGGDVVCDGTTVGSRAVTVLASTLPWKTATAVVIASVYITDIQFQSSRSAVSDPIAVRLRK